MLFCTSKYHVSCQNIVGNIFFQSCDLRWNFSDTRSPSEATHMIEPYKNEQCARPRVGKWLACAGMDSAEEWLVSLVYDSLVGFTHQINLLIYIELQKDKENKVTVFTFSINYSLWLDPIFSRRNNPFVTLACSECHLTPRRLQWINLCRTVNQTRNIVNTLESCSVKKPHVCLIQYYYQLFYK